MSAHRASGMRVGFGSLSVVAAILVTALSAALALDPSPRSGGAWLHEVGAYLAVTVLILAAARGTETTTRLFRRRRPTRHLPARLAWRLMRVAGEALLTCLLVVPAFAVGWEAGAGVVDVGETALFLGAAIAFGTLLGALFGALSGTLTLPPHAATALAFSAAALVLWPATLGGFGAMARRFPATELPPIVLPAALGLVLAALVAAVRSRERAAA